MTLDDLKLQIYITLRTTEKGFKIGEQRILAVLFLLFLAPQGARPRSILQLKFGDIAVVLVRNPKDLEGPPTLVIELSMAYTKRYLGPKATYGPVYHQKYISQESANSAQKNLPHP